MDAIIPCADSMSANVNNPEALEHSYGSRKECNGEDGLVTETGNLLDGILHIKDGRVPVLGCAVPLNRGEFSPEKKTREELKVYLANSIATTRNGLRKSATFPCSASTEEGDGTTLLEKSTTESGKSSFSRSISIPLKLLSAMKGGREKQGIVPEKKLTVTWAPDVHDPPSTTMSHTVRSYNQHYNRSRSNKKKNGKHNKHKGKQPSRGSNSDKKQPRKITGNMDSRLKSPVPSSNRFLLDDISESNIGDYDDTCGSSFLRASLPKVHISVAEAT